MPDLDLRREFESINLGDERRNRRARQLAGTISQDTRSTRSLGRPTTRRAPLRVAPLASSVGRR